MKQAIFFAVCIVATLSVAAQNYPEPEFSNEIYFLKKDSIYSVLRLEKGSSKMDTKTKLGGYGGTEMGYTLEGSKSTVRLQGGTGLCFVLSKGIVTKASSPAMDSMMRANGMDPSMTSSMEEMMNPSNTVNLYKAESAREKRKILMQKSGGAFGGKKNSSSDKYTFSLKKIRQGYWELVIDKPLPKGEYAFSVMNMGMGNMDGATLFYSFGVD